MNTDLLSRQEAIDALYHVDEYNGRSVEAIRNLPSAQPYTEADIQKMQELEQAELDKAFELGKEEGRKEAQPEIVRCKDCKHWEGEKRGQFYYFEQCSLHECTASSDDFCSWAERREE